MSILILDKYRIFRIFSGVILLLISGLHIGWGIWRTILAKNMPHLNVSLEFSVLILSSWYIGAIAGSIVSAALLTRVKKKTIYVSTANYENVLFGNLEIFQHILKLFFNEHKPILVFSTLAVARWRSAAL